jgi:hypothetical protein
LKEIQAERSVIGVEREELRWLRTLVGCYGIPTRAFPNQHAKPFPI